MASLALANLSAGVSLADLAKAVFAPDSVMFEELRQVGTGKSDEEADAAYQSTGLSAALDIIGKLQEIDRIDGLHIMAVGWEEILSSLVTQAGLYPRSKAR